VEVWFSVSWIILLPHFHTRPPGAVPFGAIAFFSCSYGYVFIYFTEKGSLEMGVDPPSPEVRSK
jgi:hypothetical protein